MMILNFDRKRLYIFGSVGLVFLLLLAFYHAPSYVPTEVSRMKTSVSTWLKGTEPSLSDETYKDSPHFNVPTKASDDESFEGGHEEHTIEPSIDYTQTFPPHNEPASQVVDDDHVDLLPPHLQSSQPPASSAMTTSKQLPDINDFIALLPPTDLLSTATDLHLTTHSLSEATGTAVDHTYSLPTPTESVAETTPGWLEPTDAIAATTFSLPEFTNVHAILETTMITQTRSATVSATESIRPGFDREKWYDEEYK